LSNQLNVRHSSKVSAGLAGKFGSHAELSLGAEKSGNTPAIISCAINYQPSLKFGLYVGVSNSVKPVYFGYSFKTGHFEISMSSGYHGILGFSPQFLFIYKRNSI
jgi:hypothetical protein